MIVIPPKMGCQRLQRLNVWLNVVYLPPETEMLG